MRCRCRHRSDVESGVVICRRGDQFGKEVAGDQSWRLADGDIDIDLLPCGQVFGHFLWALPMELSSERLEIVASHRVSKCCEAADEVVGTG